jgi:flagellar hook assembly protein FlgD
VLALLLVKSILFAGILAQNQPYLEVYPLLISPNNDGLADSLYINCYFPEEITCQLWDISIWNSNDSLILDFQGNTKPNQQLVWDGKTAAKSKLPDGPYSVGLKIITVQQDTLIAPLHWIGLNASPPILLINAQPVVISPNGDNKNDSLNIQITFIGEIKAKYELNVLNINGIVKNKWNGLIPPPEKIIWDGRDSLGNVLPDGDYWLEMTMYHKGAYRYDTPLVPFSIKTAKPRLLLQAKSYLNFSPNGDTIQDNLPINILTDQQIKDAIITITDSNNQIRDSIKLNDIPDIFFWDGLIDDKQLPDGNYFLTLNACDVADNCTESNRIDTKIDNTPPDSTETWCYNIGRSNDNIRWEINWSANIEDSSLAIVFTNDTLTYNRPRSPIIFTQIADKITPPENIILIKADSAGNQLKQNLDDGLIEDLLDIKTQQFSIWFAQRQFAIPLPSLPTTINRICASLAGKSNYKIICYSNCPNEDYMSGVRCGAELAGLGLKSLLMTNKLDARKLRAIGDSKYNSYFLLIKINQEDY